MCCITSEKPLFFHADKNPAGIPTLVHQKRQNSSYYCSSCSSRDLYLNLQLIARSRICLQCRKPWFDSWVGKISWRRDRLPTPVFLGFPCGSADKESACNVGDPGSIPGLGRSPGEGECYPVQYSGLENSLSLEGYPPLPNRVKWVTQYMKQEPRSMGVKKLFLIENTSYNLCNWFKQKSVDTKINGYVEE